MNEEVDWNAQPEIRLFDRHGRPIGWHDYERLSNSLEYRYVQAHTSHGAIIKTEWIGQDPDGSHDPPRIFRTSIHGKLKLAYHVEYTATEDLALQAQADAIAIVERDYEKMQFRLFLIFSFLGSLVVIAVLIAMLA